jgi:23S rRNA pseudouridine2605 synthase
MNKNKNYIDIDFFLDKSKKINIIKYICYCGFCSRKNALKLILENKVFISYNNEKNLGSKKMLINNPAFDLDFSNNLNKFNVYIENEIIEPINQIKLFTFHKPRGCIVSHNDPMGRQTIFDIISLNKNINKESRLIYIGRLDFNSEGIILLTNYGPLARFFELPKNKIKRIYEVKIFGKWNDSIINILKKGITIDKIKYQPINARLIKQKDKQTWIECELYEGKNNELRKIFTYFGFLVSYLKRIKYSIFSVDRINKGEIQEVYQKDLRYILDIFKDYHETDQD